MRSMSKKGCSPDSPACEGFFGRLKNEFFYDRDWKDVTIDEFVDLLDQCARLSCLASPAFEAHPLIGHMLDENGTCPIIMD